jgi:hypothetical protein
MNLQQAFVSIATLLAFTGCGFDRGTPRPRIQQGHNHTHSHSRTHDHAHHHVDSDHNHETNSAQDHQLSNQIKTSANHCKDPAQDLSTTEAKNKLIKDIVKHIQENLSSTPMSEQDQQRYRAMLECFALVDNPLEDKSCDDAMRKSILKHAFHTHSSSCHHSHSI